MHDQSAPSREGAAPFTLREAASVLGISLNTLRRRIAAGQVQAERVQRPQGHVWAVYLDGADTQEHPANGTVPEDGAGTVQHPPTAVMQAEAMAAYTRSLLEPLIATIERQAEQLVSQAEMIGRLGAELAASEARGAALLASGEPEPSDSPPEPSPFPWPLPPHPNVRGLAPWTLTVLAILSTALGTAAVMLLVWPW